MERRGNKGTLWFDKVCINQCSADDTAKTIASLPVNISACRQVLVLLGPEYLKRLWCVWELQSVFTFCLKELAVERVVVVAVDGGVTRDSFLKWSLDEAHCFDPNEEFRLRRLMHSMGEHRFVSSVHNLAECELHGLINEGEGGAGENAGMDESTGGDSVDAGASPDARLGV